MAVTKLESTYYLSDSTGLTVKTSKAMVETVFDTIRMTLAAGEGVKLPGVVIALDALFVWSQ